MLSGGQMRQKYLDFFASRGHVVLPSAPIVLSGDPTTLFTSSGMQPLVPYLLGETHPAGARLVNSQKCIRTQDIEEVGDNRHFTFFEMLGNWSLGDYFKKEQLAWAWEFFTKEVGLPKEKLHVTLFEGNDQVSRDEESARIWKELGVPDDRVHYYDAKKNWWSRSGTPDQMPAGEPGGPDSEVFYDFGTPHDPKYGQKCHPNCDCGRFLEIGNSVFMQYQKQADGSLKELAQKNVDFGGGLERILAAANDDPDIFKTDFFWPIIEKIQKITSQKYEDYPSEMRIIADHLKAATFLIFDHVEPGNKQSGYVLRRLLRRAIVKMKSINSEQYGQTLGQIAREVFEIYKDDYLPLKDFRPWIVDVFGDEVEKFKKSLYAGINKINDTPKEKINAQFVFDLYQSYGYPIDISLEILKKSGVYISTDEVEKIKEKHQQSSRSASAGMFKGGLADQSETVTKYHTATHLLQQALRDVLGDHVHQAGSNITGERLRFDFTHSKALSEDELTKVENLINSKVDENLPVTSRTTTYEDAIESGALAFFKEKYPEKVTVYKIGDYSQEVCGGPHVASTGEIGNIEIIKQESAGSSLRRIYLRLLPR